LKKHGQIYRTFSKYYHLQAEQLKILMLKYREPPLTVAKTSHLLTFLHHLLILVPISSNGANPTFPLSQLFEDLGMTLTLRPTPQNPFAYQIWIMNLQFMLSCIKQVEPQALYNAGITTPVVLGIIKHVLLELTRLPIDANAIQQKCFDIGKEFLDTFLLKQTSEEAPTVSAIPRNNVLPNVSYYDIIFSVSWILCSAYFLAAAGIANLTRLPDTSF
jgi:hypothetical protein